MNKPTLSVMDRKRIYRDGTGHDVNLTLPNFLILDNDV